MVLSIDVPLKASEEATVKFLLEIAFGSQKKLNLQSTRQCLSHDVFQMPRVVPVVPNENQPSNMEEGSEGVSLPRSTTIYLSCTCIIIIGFLIAAIVLYVILPFPLDIPSDHEFFYGK
ncbi:LEM-like domain-containing protein [Caenorhabditis elegans]|uniref:LEM-like domain-containing protein n=1 Tax=Caenorhabditis elegans TaxID=6239 RepID=Q4TT80_CAEEL|nr:LEM-like domain-containing protein [Caenorhabditis elegans]CCD61223.1 LEM-like domain-containing protein [Caenorhabditis elegans]|eukprot:NP_001020982.2 Uncharacterized protein CELE_C06A5.12 [Caenorhabditis elegans]